MQIVQLHYWLRFISNREPIYMKFYERTGISCFIRNRHKVRAKKLDIISNQEKVLTLVNDSPLFLNTFRAIFPTKIFSSIFCDLICVQF